MVSSVLVRMRRVSLDRTFFRGGHSKSKERHCQTSSDGRADQTSAHQSNRTPTGYGHRLGYLSLSSQMDNRCHPSSHGGGELSAQRDKESQWRREYRRRRLHEASSFQTRRQSAFQAY